MLRVPTLLALAISLVCVEADATLTPVGDEIAVTTNTDNDVHSPRVAVAPNGGFHVVWQSFSSEDDSEWDIHARSFDASGMALGDEIVVNTHTEGFQEAPTIAIADGREFVVSWSGAGEDDDYGVFARVFGARGTARTDELSLHDATSSVFEREPSAAGDNDGFLVAWIEDARVAGVRLDATGVKRGQFENAVDQPQHVAIDSLPESEFVVAWSSSEYSTSGVAYGYAGIVEGRFFAADDVGGDGFQVNAARDDPTGYGFVIDGKRTLAVSADASGDFVAGFDSYVPSYVYNVDAEVDGFDIGLQTERFVDREAQGARFVSDDPTAAGWADVAMTPGGNAVSAEDGAGILVHAVDCRGDDASEGAVSVEADDALLPARPAVAVNENGDVVVVWQQHNEGDTGSTIAARRLRLTDACALCGDADANGRVTATDALAALRASVALETCIPERCDTDGSQSVTATDALRILTQSVAEGPPALSCVAAS